MTVASLKVVPKRIKAPKNGDLRIWVGALKPEDGFVKIGYEKDEPHHLVDLLSPPWPIDSSSVQTVYAAYYFHRITLEQRFVFMNEVYRILKPGAQLIMCMPHWSSSRSIADPEAKWPPVHETTFMWFNRKWRENESMTHLPIDCDFCDVYGVGTTLDGEISLRNEDYQLHARKYWVNANQDLHVTLTKP